MMAIETKRIKCAHCKEYHGSIDEVKACAAVHNAAKVFAPEPDGFCTRCQQKIWTQGDGTLMGHPCEEPVPPAQPAYVTLRQNAKRDAVPAGRYAIEDEGIIKFYVVDRPTEGRWAGRVFVKRQVSDDLFPLKTWRATNVVLDQIAANVQEASLRYGREIGYCGVCGKLLTNTESRRVGIGPVCRSRMGW